MSTQPDNDDREIRRASIIHRIRTLPTLPTVLLRIINTLEDPMSSAGDLERIVRHDQAITSKLLAVANSAYYSYRHEISTVRRAVVVIGFNEVRNICLGLSLTGYLHPSKFKNQRLAQLLWMHSMMVAEAAKVMAEISRRIEPDTAFTAGLLHDLGKVILAAYLPEEVDELRRLSQQEDLPFRQLELELGLSHELIGRELASQWELPETLQEVMARHHANRGGLEHPELVRTVQLADYVSRDLGFKDAYRLDVPKVPGEALEQAGLGKGEILRAAKILKTRSAGVLVLWRELMGIEQEPDAIAAAH